MRLFLFFITVISVSAFSGPVKDFAPDQVGNTWKYHVGFSYEHLTEPLSDDENFIRTIKIAKIDSMQNNKIYIFEISDSGLRINYPTSNPDKKDSIAINKRFSDTCSQIGDSIVNTPSFGVLYSSHLDTMASSIRFFPLFERHAIESGDSGITKIFYKNDSLFQFKNGISSNWSSYVQNVGLDSLVTIWLGNTHLSCFVYLISYSIIPTAISKISPNFHAIQAIRQNFSNAYIYDLQGRRFQYRKLSVLPPGLMVNYGVKYWELKY